MRLHLQKLVSVLRYIALAPMSRRTSIIAAVSNPEKVGPLIFPFIVPLTLTMMQIHNTGKTILATLPFGSSYVSYITKASLNIRNGHRDDGSWNALEEPLGARDMI